MTLVHLGHDRAGRDGADAVPGTDEGSGPVRLTVLTGTLPDTHERRTRVAAASARGFRTVALPRSAHRRA